MDDQLAAKKEHFLDLIEDEVSDFCYYDRKGCEALGRRDVADLIEGGHVTLKEILGRYECAFLKNFPSIKRT